MTHLEFVIYIVWLKACDCGPGLKGDIKGMELVAFPTRGKFLKIQGDGNVGNRTLTCNLFSHILTLGKPMNIPLMRTLKRKKINIYKEFSRASDDYGHASM